MPNYSILRTTSWCFIAVFIALQNLWILRYVRNYETSLTFLEPFARTEFAALLEHFAAGWGGPAIVFALLGLSLSKDDKSVDSSSRQKESFQLLGIVTFVAIAYLTAGKALVS